MQISEYVEQARSTAIYSAPFDYPAHGISGEIGEVLDKLTTMPILKDDITLELGDCLWYVVNTLEDAELSLLNLCELVAGCCSNFTEVGVAFNYGNDNRSTLVKLPIYAGRINEIAKKMIRDSSGVLPSDKKPIVKDCICHIIVCLYDICTQLDINMDDVAQANIDKLFSRRDRGVIGGSGDRR